MQKCLRFEACIGEKVNCSRASQLHLRKLLFMGGLHGIRGTVSEGC